MIETAIPDPTATGSDYRRLLDLGITPSQIQHWTRKGYIRGVVEHEAGVGIRRFYDASEIWVARWMALLTRNGVRPARAAELARNHDEHHLSRLVCLLICPSKGAPDEV